ncbi:hypothetical protein [Streptomyces sp. NPDC058457]
MDRGPVAGVATDHGARLIIVTTEPTPYEDQGEPEYVRCFAL